MKTPQRALTLNIDANSVDDMQMLLKQALYEIEKLLPLPAGTTPEQADLHRRSKWAEVDLPVSQRVIKGGTVGSIGSYEFTFIRSSREFSKLEEQLLSQGYKANESRDFLDSSTYYVHPSLPKKIITGNPLEIQDKPEPATNEDGDIFF